jgi:hypothetical protein
MNSGQQGAKKTEYQAAGRISSDKSIEQQKYRGTLYESGGRLCVLVKHLIVGLLQLSLYLGDVSIDSINKIPRPSTYFQYNGKFPPFSVSLEGALPTQTDFRTLLQPYPGTTSTGDMIHRRQDPQGNMIHREHDSHGT